jgi:hypothetical protein
MARCPFCRTTYKPARMGQGCCLNLDCIILAGQARKAKEAAKQAKAERAAIKVRKEAAKRPNTLKAEAQAAFNAYIRARDLSAGHNCIDCDKPFEPQKPGGSVDAGHYLSRGSHPNLAFSEQNCFAQRKNCNRPGGTTATAFRLGVIDRIGLDAVEALESDTTPRRYRAEDYRAIRDLYRSKLKELKANE